MHLELAIPTLDDMMIRSLHKKPRPFGSGDQNLAPPAALRFAYRDTVLTHILHISALYPRSVNETRLSILLKYFSLEQPHDDPHPTIAHRRENHRQDGIADSIPQRIMIDCVQQNYPETHHWLSCEQQVADTVPGACERDAQQGIPYDECPQQCEFIDTWKKEEDKEREQEAYSRCWKKDKECADRKPKRYFMWALLDTDDRLEMMDDPLEHVFYELHTEQNMSRFINIFIPPICKQEHELHHRSERVGDPRNRCEWYDSRCCQGRADTRRPRDSPACP